MIRPARHQNLGGDLPWFAGTLIVIGGVVAIVVRGVVDLALHRHRAA
jgi:hypothetical protein